MPARREVTGRRLASSADSAIVQPPTWLELERVLTLTELAALLSLSPDTIKRRYRDQLVYLSARRLGMQMKKALAIAAGARS